MRKFKKSFKVVKKNFKPYVDLKKELKDNISKESNNSFNEFEAKIDALSEWNDVLDDEDRERAFMEDS